MNATESGGDHWLLSDSLLEHESGGDHWLLSDSLLEYVQLVNIVIISGLVSVFGVVTNIINLIVFYRLGFRETINISLFAIAISDLGASLFLVWITICFNPRLSQEDIDIHFIDIYYYTGAWARYVFMFTTAFLTAFITVERFLCIVYPLSIKRLMTKRKTLAIIIAIFILNVAPFVVELPSVRIDWTWISSKNRSMISTVYVRSSSEHLAEILAPNLSAIYSFFTYSIVTIFTALFVLKLSQRSKWRQSVSAGRGVTSSVRDLQIIKMVTCVAVIFILCYSPFIFNTLLTMASPEVDYGGKYHNLYILLDSLDTSIGSLNASVNIFIYYSMMSKYRAVIRSKTAKHHNDNKGKAS